MNFKEVQAPDTGSWPANFTELKLIDDALRCGICYEYLKVAMVTPCAHSYCSICIRRSLLYKTACPSCFEETFENTLRNNRTLDRVVELFSSVKDKLIKHLKIAAVHFSCNEQLKTPSSNQTQLGQKTLLEATPKSVKKTLKTSSTKAKCNSTLNSTTYNSNVGVKEKSNISKKLEDILGSPSSNNQANIAESVDITKSDEFPTIPPMFLQQGPSISKIEPQMPVYPCPVCMVNIPERNMNGHLDVCLANIDKPPVRSQVKTKQTRAPLKKMVWSLMGEKDLRKKLKDYGLNTQGDKKTLINRLQRYTLLYNSECDSDNPRPVSEIIKQVEREEKQTPAQNQQRLVINKKSDPKLIEEENKKYIEENKSSFNKLIEAMRQREGRNIKPLSLVSNRITSDDEDFETDSCDAVLMGIDHKKSKLKTTSKFEEETINLSDDEDNFVSSPVLGSSVPEDSKKLNSHSLDNVKSSNSKENINRLSNALDSSNDKISNNITHHFDGQDESVSYSPKQFDESRSCIEEEDVSGSEDSFSLLSHQNIDPDLVCNGDTDSNVNVPADSNKSQLVDPDFKVNSEDLFDNEDTEEVFVPKKKSKRKSLISPEVSPRRTRRRFNK